MTAQQSPHTPPSRRVLSLPLNALGWVAVGLTAGAALFLILIFGRFLNVLMVVDFFGEGMLLGVAGLLAAVVGLLALLRSPQQSPHTTPLSRRVLSLPHTRLGWVAVGMASPVWALWIYSIIATLLSGAAITYEGVFFVLLFSGLLVIPGAAAGVFALLRSHDRSLLVWLAIVPALLFISFTLVLMLVEMV